MANFHCEGNKFYHHWLVDGCRNWALIPAGTVRGFNFDLPVRVLVGESGWGYRHILRNKGRIKLMFDSGYDPCDFIYFKLGQSGSIYSTYDNNRIQVCMRISPSWLVVFEVMDKNPDDVFLSLVTMYPVNKRIDGDVLGRYSGDFRALENLPVCNRQLNNFEK